MLRSPAAGRPARKRDKRACFQPLALGRNGHCQLNDRTWVPAMVPWRATEDGNVTPDVLDWYRRFAQGRPGVIVVEATASATFHRALAAHWP